MSKILKLERCYQCKQLWPTGSCQAVVVEGIETVIGTERICPDCFQTTSLRGEQSHETNPSTSHSQSTNLTPDMSAVNQPTVNKQTSTPHSESLRLLDIVDNWYHEQTRHHLVDIDPNAMKNLIAPLEDHSLQEQIDLLKTVKASFDNHAKSIGLWGMEGLALDTLARSGNLSDEQKAERDAMVTERRALAVLHGVIDAEIATLEAERKKL